MVENQTVYWVENTTRENQQEEGDIREKDKRELEGKDEMQMRRGEVRLLISYIFIIIIFFSIYLFLFYYNIFS